MATLPGGAIVGWQEKEYGMLNDPRLELVECGIRRIGHLE